MTRVRIAARGFLLVFLVSLNTGQIAGQHYVGAAVGGFCISALWWGNSKRSGRCDDVPYAGACYAAGASLGTLAGMFVTRWIYG